MKTRAPRRFDEIKPSPTLALSARVKAMVAQGRDIANLTAGEPDMPPPDFVLEALAEIEAGATTRYTDSRGQPAAREALCAWLAREAGVDYAPEEVLLLDGAKRALALGIHALAEAGDELALFSPYWVSYQPMIHLADATPVVVPTRFEDGFRPDMAQLEAATTPQTVALIMNSPQNPTGVVYAEAELDAIADYVTRHDLLLIADDIYQHIQLRQPAVPPILARHPELKERTLLIHSLSKAFGVPGWRVGFAAGPRWLIDRMTRAWAHTGSNLNGIMQALVTRVLGAPMDFCEGRAQRFRARRDLAVDRLASMPGVRVLPPDGAFYVFPDLNGILGRRFDGRVVEDTLTLAELLLEHARVAAVPGEAFGAPGYLRMTLAAADEQIAAGLDRMAEFLAGMT